MIFWVAWWSFLAGVWVGSLDRDAESAYVRRWERLRREYARTHSNHDGKSW